MEKPNSPSSTEAAISLRHLQAELTRIDILIQRQVRRWQLAGQDPEDAFRGLHITDTEADALARRPLGTSWGYLVTLAPDEDRMFETAYVQARLQTESVSEIARQQGQTPRLEQLAHAFSLDEFDLDTLLICLAPTLDLRYERLYGYLQDDVTRKLPRVSLVLDLLAPPDPAERMPLLLRFAPDAPVFKYHLLERANGPEVPKLPLLSQTLRVDGTIVAWLLGGYQPHDELGSHVTLGWPDESEEDVLLSNVASSKALIECVSDGDGVSSVGDPVVVFHGADKLAQEAAARRLAARVERPLLAVDLAAVTESGVAPLRALRLALRDARLNSALPYLSGWDACLPAPGQSDAKELVPPLPDLLAELCGYPDLVLVAGQTAWQPAGIDRQRPFLWVEFPVPEHAHRQALWQHFLAAGTGMSSTGLDTVPVAGQFALSSGQIRDAVASACDRAFQADRELQSEDLFVAARAHSSPHLGSLARQIVPRYTWDDIVLAPDQLALLHEVVDTVRERPLVLRDWGVGRKLASSEGVTMLFSGEPGTGKTMAAEVMAAELGLDLYKIDLSTVVSKYIGETEKNLEKIFGEAQSSNAILFFDEADAIFGKRSEVKDAHDRYANLEISYLLQRMEMYDGVTILATNLRANLDEAFTRRLQFAVDFAFPDEEYRLRIWQTLMPEDVPRDPDLDLELLARRFKLAGGNIRNILVGAAFLAAADGRRLGMRHLLHGTRRELQKMGRLVNESDMRIS
ncbi:MAG TPA: ATP-binding protein [Anaerolineae bacterium]|nr:ATP-binding protein [Anaerolineae bacterium]